MKILANDGISQAGVQRLQDAGVTIITENVPQEKLAEAINAEGYVGLMVRSATTVRKELIDACPGLRMIGRGGVGMDNIDVEYARSKGIEVFNTPAASSQSVAELVMAHLFGAARGLHDANRQMPDRGASDFKPLKKNYGKGIELRGKKLGILGFGRIGRSLASYALGCGVEVIASDPFATDGRVELDVPGHGSFAVDVPMVPLDELLRESHFISLHIPAQKDGPVISAAQFEIMRQGVILVNAARGGVVHEEDLMAALDAGKVRVAALDVFDNEPTPREDILRHPGVSLTPHIGAATVEAQDRIGLELADRILEVLQVAQ